MKKKRDNFIIQRLKGILFSFRGIGILIRTEDSIKVQLCFVVIAIILGFYFSISLTEWILQTTVIGLVLVSEALNTAIEKLSDFIHPDYHKKIGIVKDISAGAPGIAAIISLVVACLIYIPKLIQIFK